MLGRGYSRLPLRIEFNSVRVHWPMLVAALQEAGFTISSTPKQDRSRSGPPKRATQTPVRKRGRKPKIFNSVVATMHADLEAGRLTREALGTKLEKELAGDYQVSRYTARRARNHVLNDAPRDLLSRR
jgi:hypothetical protein